MDRSCLIILMYIPSPKLVQGPKMLGLGLCQGVHVRRNFNSSGDPSHQPIEIPTLCARFCCSGGSAWGPRCEYAICVPKSKPKLLHVLPASSSAFLINWVYSFRRLCLASLRSESPHLLHLIFLLHKYHMSMLPVSLRLCVFLPACFWCLGHLNVYGNYGLHKSVQNFIVARVFSAGVQNCWLAYGIDWAFLLIKGAS